MVAKKQHINYYVDIELVKEINNYPFHGSTNVF